MKIEKGEKRKERKKKQFGKTKLKSKKWRFFMENVETAPISVISWRDLKEEEREHILLYDPKSGDMGDVNIFTAVFSNKFFPITSEAMQKILHVAEHKRREEKKRPKLGSSSVGTKISKPARKRNLCAINV